MVKKVQGAATTARKRRTREHVIADLSVNFVERLVIEAGYTVTRTIVDYGYDLILETFDEDGFVEPGLAYLQLKATDEIARYERDGAYWFPIDLRDHHRWVEEAFPVFLVLFDAGTRRAFWLHVQAYFREHPVKNLQAGSVRVCFAGKKRLRRGTIQVMRKIKADVLRRLKKKEDQP
jgi:hypothetical protein